MIRTKLTTADAHEIMRLGQQLHKESRFDEEPFDPQRCWALLNGTSLYPEKYFIAFDEEYKGFILMINTEHYFSGTRHASDLALYIAPENRGGSLVVRLLNEAEKWAKETGARELTIYHNTGINTESAPKLFNKLGFNMNGYIFSKGIK